MDTETKKLLLLNKQTVQKLTDLQVVNRQARSNNPEDPGDTEYTSILLTMTSGLPTSRPE